jgi:hypothetical protein
MAIHKREVLTYISHKKIDQTFLVGDVPHYYQNAGATATFLKAIHCATSEPHPRNKHTLLYSRSFDPNTSGLEECDGCPQRAPLSSGCPIYEYASVNAPTKA